MLSEIRDRSSGWFAWVIASLIIIPMAFWGIQEYAGTGVVPTVVSIGDKKITLNDYQSALTQEQNRMQQTMGDRVNNEILNSDRFKQSVLQRLMNQSVVEYVADEHRYRIGDEQLALMIKKSDLFKIDGKFNIEAYENYLQGNLYSKTQYENEIRNRTVLNQVTSGYQESAFVLPDEIRLLLEAQAEQRTVDIVTINQQDYLAKVSASEEEIAEYYTQNENQFMQSEKMSAKYISLSQDALTSNEEIDEDELRAIYEQSIDSYMTQEEREISHILLTVNEDNDASQKAKGESLIADLSNGADFAELAKSNSEDTGSASDGGNLGIIEPGQMLPEFEDAAYSLSDGQVSELIKTEFGYHILKLSKLVPSVTQPFEEVRDEIEQEENRQIAEEAFLDKLNALRDLAYENPESLEIAAEELDLKVESTSIFDRDSGTDIASSIAFRETAFSDEIIFEGINSEPVEIGDGQYVVLRKDTYVAKEPKALALVTDQIKEFLNYQKASDEALKVGNEFIAKAQNDWDVSVGESGYTSINKVISFTNPDLVIDPSVFDKVTKLKLIDDKPVIDYAVDTNGNFHAIRLTKIEQGNINNLSEQIKAGTRRLIAQRNGQSLLSNYMDFLKSNLAEEINQDLL